MTTTPTAAKVTMSRTEWIVLGLLVASIFINYIDRSNLSVGATDIQNELHLSHYQLGKLLSAFFWTYAIFQLFVISGWLVDRFNVCWVFAAGYLLWSGATAATGLVSSFSMLFALRLVLGAGESVAYPAYSKILANHFPEYHRGLANALIDAGSKLGPALGTLLGGYLMVVVGWRAFFVVLGVVSMLWLIPWVRYMPQGSGISAGRDPRECPAVLDIVRQRSAWGTFLGLFCANYFWYFLVTWLPAYLERERHFPKTKMALFGSLSFFVIAVASITSGYLSDRWIARGGSPTRVRKLFTSVGLAGSAVILPMAIVQNETLAMALLMVACVSYGVFASNHWAISQTLSGPLAAGKWTGLQNGVGNLAGIASPWATGWVVQQTGEFYLAFVVAAAVVLTGSASYIFIVGPVEPVAFPAHRPA
jgi:MFS transporter, ACS family, D-galactonate transporter